MRVWACLLLLLLSAVMLPNGSAAPYVLHWIGDTAAAEGKLTPEQAPMSWNMGPGSGFLSVTADCDAPAAAPSHHTWYAVPGRSPAEKGPDQRGLDLDLAFEEEAYVVVYLEDSNTVPGVVAQLTIEATIRTGDELSVDASALEDGTTIAQGMLGPVDLVPGQDSQVIDGRNVWGFVVPLAFEAGEVAQEDSFNLAIRATVRTPACDGGIMPPHVTLHSSTDATTRLELGVQDPINVIFTDIRRDIGATEYFVRASTPFGGHDLRVKDAFVEGIPEAVLTPVAGAAQPNASGAFAAGERALDLTYVWSHGAMDPAGHTLVVELENLQGTANKTVRLMVPAQATSEQSPPGPMSLLAASILWAAMVVHKGRAERLAQRR